MNSRKRPLNNNNYRMLEFLHINFYLPFFCTSSYVLIWKIIEVQKCTIQHRRDLIMEPLVCILWFYLFIHGVKFCEVLDRWVFWDRLLLCKADQNAIYTNFLMYLLFLKYRIILSLYSFQIIIVYRTWLLKELIISFHKYLTWFFLNYNVLFKLFCYTTFIDIHDQVFCYCSKFDKFNTCCISIEGVIILIS